MEVKLDLQPPLLSWRAWWQEQQVFCADLWLCHEIKPYKVGYVFRGSRGWGCGPPWGVLDAGSAAHARMSSTPLAPIHPQSTPSMLAAQDEPMAPSDWDLHQSWRRHCLEPRTYLRVLRVLCVIEAWVLGVTVFAGLYATYLQPRPGWWVLVSKDWMPLFTLLMLALALLITFRTNTAHGRWWEVRSEALARERACRGGRGGVGAAAPWRTSCAGCNRLVQVPARGSPSDRTVFEALNRAHQPAPRQARSLVGRWLAIVRNCQRMFQSWATPEDAPLVEEFTRWNAALTAVGALLRGGDGVRGGGSLALSSAFAQVVRVLAGIFLGPYHVVRRAVHVPCRGAQRSRRVCAFTAGCTQPASTCAETRSTGSL